MSKCGTSIEHLIVENNKLKEENSREIFVNQEATLLQLNARKKKRKLKLYKIWLTNTSTINLNLATLLDKKNFLNAESNAG